MSAVVPHRFLFRYRMPVRYKARLPKKGRKLLDLPGDCAIPDFGELDDAQCFGEVRIAWNSKGVGFSVHVSGKKQPLFRDLAEPTDSDGFQVWIDTRNTQSIHRASRFCHHFCFLPCGPETKAPVAMQLPIARAREDAPLSRSEDLRVFQQTRKDGYVLEAWLSSDQLTGFDPEANPLLGFYYYLRDSELGEQFLTVGREFPFAHDPSLWATLELVR